MEKFIESFFSATPLSQFIIVLFFIVSLCFPFVLLLLCVRWFTSNKVIYKIIDSNSWHGPSQVTANPLEISVDPKRTDGEEKQISELNKQIFELNKQIFELEREKRGS